MIHVEHSVVINRPIEEVFSFVSDIEKMPQWAAEVVEAKQISEGAMGMGTTVKIAVKVLGRRAENTHKVTAYEPNSKFAFKTTSGPIQSEVTESVESVEDGTKFTIVAEAETGGFFKLAEPIVARTTQREWETNVATLKDLLEARA